MKGSAVSVAIGFFALWTAGAQAEPAGKRIYEDVCQTCHAAEMTRAEARAAEDMLGPPMNLMVPHLRAQLDHDKEAFVGHVVAFTISPSRDRALARESGIERFGLMPSLETIAPQLDRADLRAVAHWLWQRYEPRTQTGDPERERPHGGETGDEEANAQPN